MQARRLIGDLSACLRVAVIFSRDRLDQTGCALDLTLCAGLFVSDRYNALLGIFKGPGRLYSPAGDLFVVAILKICRHNKAGIVLVQNRTRFGVAAIDSGNVIDSFILGRSAKEESSGSCCKDHSGSDQNALAVSLPKTCMCAVIRLPVCVHLCASLLFGI